MKKTLKLLIFTLLSIAAVAAQARTVQVETLNTLKFNPESITVKPGEQVTIRLVNKTRLPASAMSHNWVLLAAGADAYRVNRAGISAGRNRDYIPQHMGKKILAHTDLIAGGESDTITFTAPEKPGDYEYICTFPGHFAAGMTGELVVKAE